MVEKYHELKSSLQVIESWKREYPNDKPPTEAPVLYNVKKFHHNGRINNDDGIYKFYSNIST